MAFLNISLRDKSLPLSLSLSFGFYSIMHNELGLREMLQRLQTRLLLVENLWLFFPFRYFYFGNLTYPVDVFSAIN